MGRYYNHYKVISHFWLTESKSLVYAQYSLNEHIFLKSNEIARFLGISRRTLTLWVKQGRIPEPEKSMAGYFLWTETDLLNVKGVTKRSPGPQPGISVRRRPHAA